MGHGKESKYFALLPNFLSDRCQSEKKRRRRYLHLLLLFRSLSLFPFSPGGGRRRRLLTWSEFPKRGRQPVATLSIRRWLQLFLTPPFFVLHCLVTNKPGDSVATGKKGRGEITTPLLIGAFNHPPDCNLGCKSQLCLHQKISLLEKFFFCCAKEEYSHTLHFMFFLLEDAMCTRCASIV